MRYGSNFLKRCYARILVDPSVAAIVVAVLFYNIYDVFDLGTKLKTIAGWRGALIVGALSGLVSESDYYHAPDPFNGAIEVR